jgi:hypothetical protein
MFEVILDEIDFRAFPDLFYESSVKVSPISNGVPRDRVSVFHSCEHLKFLLPSLTQLQPEIFSYGMEISHP